MATNVFDALQGQQPAPYLPPTPAPVVQPTGYLHPILLSYLQSLPNPNIVITSHPAFPILMQSHPTIMAATQAGQQYPSEPLTSADAWSSSSSQSRVPATASSGTSVGGPIPSSPTQSPSLNPATASPFSQNAVNPSQSQPQFNAPVGSMPSGTPNPTMGASAGQQLPTMGPNATPPIGNTSASPVSGGSLWNNISGWINNGMIGSGPSGIPVTRNQGVQQIGSNPVNFGSQSGVQNGPLAANHVPYGPELTGLSGYGGLITPNGTPVAMSQWQRLMLDPTSVARYEDYAGSIAGFSPDDLKQIGMSETGNLNENAPTVKAPINFTPINPIPGGTGG